MCWAGAGGPDSCSHVFVACSVMSSALLLTLCCDQAYLATQLKCLLTSLVYSDGSWNIFRLKSPAITLWMTHLILYGGVDFSPFWYSSWFKQMFWVVCFLFPKIIDIPKNVPFGRYSSMWSYKEGLRWSENWWIVNVEVNVTYLWPRICISYLKVVDDFKLCLS